MKNFDGLGLDKILTQSLREMKYETPTPIQAKAIPLALDGRDIMGTAQTGTGKTAAFAIPLVQTLLSDPSAHALVMTPTRELGKQVLGIIRELLGRDSGINTAFLIGGDSMQKQMNQLRKKPRIIVGTPGRINDHLERGSVNLSQTNFLVLDETDRMLDMGFSVQLDRIFKFLPKKRQSLMFSATLPKNIIEMSKRYLTNPERIKVGSTIEPAKNIQQTVVRLADNEKADELLDQLSRCAGTVIIFVKTKYGTERMAKRLKSQGYDADALHGDLKQSRRDRVLTNFRDMKFQILVATDVAARGLDVPHIGHVINYDLPQVPEDFIHRIGRTARAGATGEAISFVSPQDGRKWHAIEMLLDPTMKGSSMPNKRAAKPRGKFAGKKKPFGKSKNRHDEKPYGKKKPFSKTKKGGEAAGVKKKTASKKPFKKSNDDNASSESGFKKKNPFKRGEKNSNKKNDNRSEGDFKKRDDKKASSKKSYAKKPQGGFKGKPKSDGAKSSEGRNDGSGFIKRKTKSAKLSGKPSGKPSGFKGGARKNVSGATKGPNKGGKNFGGGKGKSFGKANKSRPATGGGKRPKGRVA